MSDYLTRLVEGARVAPAGAVRAVLPSAFAPAELPVALEPPSFRKTAATDHAQNVRNSEMPRQPSTREPAAPERPPIAPLEASLPMPQTSSTRTTRQPEVSPTSPVATASLSIADGTLPGSMPPPVPDPLPKPEISPALTPPSASPSISLRRQTARFENSNPAAPATVRVTIGRVEVRAILPAPKAAPAAAKAAPKLSLDDYLKSRNGQAA